MVYNPHLAQRLRQAATHFSNIQEKKMFGGIAFLVDGNMAFGIHGDNLIVRLSPQNGSQALTQPHTRPFDLSGKPMAGWIYVEPEGCTSDSTLRDWIAQGAAYAHSLPPK